MTRCVRVISSTTAATTVAGVTGGVRCRRVRGGLRRWRIGFIGRPASACLCLPLLLLPLPLLPHPPAFAGPEQWFPQLRKPTLTKQLRRKISKTLGRPISPRYTEGGGVRASFPGVGGSPAAGRHASAAPLSGRPRSNTYVPKASSSFSGPRLSPGGGGGVELIQPFFHEQPLASDETCAPQGFSRHHH